MDHYVFPSQEHHTDWLFAAVALHQSHSCPNQNVLCYMMIKICGGFGIFDDISGISSGSFVRWDFGKKRSEVEALEMLVAQNLQDLLGKAIALVERADELSGPTQPRRSLG